jgi:hypothetical protein
MYCSNCGNEIKEGGRYCPSCGAAIDTTARDVTPRANPQGGQIQSEASSRSREGSSRTPPRENVTTGNLDGNVRPPIDLPALAEAI